MIKGRYVGLIAVEFCVDEKMQGLLPFDELHDAVVNKFNGVVKSLIEDEVGEIAEVEVIQQYADLCKTEDGDTNGEEEKA